MPVGMCPGKWAINGTRRRRSWAYNYSDTGVEPGKLEGIQTLIGGRFFSEEAVVRVFLTMISVETGTVMVNTEFAIPRSEISETISILPDNYNNALYVLEELYKVQNAGSRIT